MPLGGLVVAGITAVVSIAGTLISNSTQKKMAAKSASLQIQLAQQQADQAKQQAKVQAGVQRLTDITQLMAGVAENYQSTVLTQQQIANTDKQKKLLEIISIAGVVIALGSIAYIFTHLNSK